MILGLDISTSITGITLLDSDGKIVYNLAVDTRKYKDFFEKAEVIEREVKELARACKEFGIEIDQIFIEQSLQTFRSGFSSAKTLSTLSRFNGLVSWLSYQIFGVKPQYIAATSARKQAGIKVPKGVKGKQAVMKHVIDNVPEVAIEYTRAGNPKPECFDKADSWVIARAGWLLCQKERN
jgi:hypothetical protein